VGVAVSVVVLSDREAAIERLDLLELVQLELNHQFQVKRC
jgi:hypothetical protein